MGVTVSTGITEAGYEKLMSVVTVEGCLNYLISTIVFRSTSKHFSWSARVLSSEVASSCLTSRKVFLPPVGFYYVTNVLAILGPRTFVYRLALLPVTLFMAYRTTMSLDIARGFLATDAEKLDWMNQALVVRWSFGSVSRV